MSAPNSERVFCTFLIKLSYYQPYERKNELLAPGRDIVPVKAAIVAGADAIYFGPITFNTRMSIGVGPNQAELGDIIEWR